MTVNVSRFASHAPLLTPRGVSAVELPALTPEGVARRVDAVQSALRLTSDRTASAARRLAARRRLSSHLAWLWTGTAAPVLAELPHRIPPETSQQPLLRGWWSPGGLLGMLPLHAAGLPDGPSLLDHVVSSYTPTVRALRHARTRSSSTAAESGLIVSMPVTPGLGPDGWGRLRHAASEAAAVRRYLPEAVVYATSEDDPADGSPPAPPTRAAVMAEQTGTTVAHFACHAVTHHTDPARSGLLLADHADGPLTVADLAAVDLDRARLAHLSACTTAASRAAHLLDEAVHLASACQFAGYPQVVGTLWEIQDSSAAGIPESFYAGLAGNTSAGEHRRGAKAEENDAPESLNTDRSARTLHAAVCARSGATCRKCPPSGRPTFTQGRDLGALPQRHGSRNVGHGPARPNGEPLAWHTGVASGAERIRRLLEQQRYA